MTDVAVFTFLSYGGGLSAYLFWQHYKKGLIAKAIASASVGKKVTLRKIRIVQDVTLRIVEGQYPTIVSVELKNQEAISTVVEELKP